MVHFCNFRFKTNEILTIMSHWKLLFGRVFLVFAFKTNEISIVFLKKKPQKLKKTKKPKKPKSRRARFWSEGRSSRHDTVTPWHYDTVTPRQGVAWHGVTVSRCHGVTVSRCHGVTVSQCHGVTVSRCHGVMSRAPPLRSESGSTTFWFFLFFGFLGFFFSKKLLIFRWFQKQKPKRRVQHLVFSGS